MILLKLKMTKKYADDDKTLQAEYKLSGLCKHCGADPVSTRSGTYSKHRGLCMECYIYERTHEKK